MPGARVPANLRIGVVQLSPKIGQVQANLIKARELCKKIQPHSLDVLCFPEMAFTGYVFENASAISPYLEQPHTGVTSQFCAELAKKLGCYVLAGYPEELSPTEVAEVGDPLTGMPHRTTPKGEAIRQVGANSAAFCGPDGEWVGGYRKTHLYETDLTWAKPGAGFATFNLPSPIRTLTLGICMDLNPQVSEWTTAEGPYELADHCLEKKTNVLILLNAWLDSGKEEEEESDWHTLNYWAARTRPLWTDGMGDRSPPSDEDQEEENDSTSQKGDETIIVVCNRSGGENDMQNIRGIVCNLQRQARLWASQAAGHDGTTRRRHPSVEYPGLITELTSTPLFQSNRLTSNSLYH